MSAVTNVSIHVYEGEIRIRHGAYKVEEDAFYLQIMYDGGEVAFHRLSVEDMMRLADRIYDAARSCADKLRPSVSLKAPDEVA
jgi:hypothetical protein